MSEIDGIDLFLDDVEVCAADVEVEAIPLSAVER